MGLRVFYFVGRSTILGLTLAFSWAQSAAADVIFLRSGVPAFSDSISGARPEALVSGHDPAEYARIAAEIAPARIYWHIPFPFLRADIEDVTWSDANGEGGVLYARVWSREFPGGPKTYSPRLIAFPMDQVSISVDFNSIIDIRLFFSNIDERVGPIGSEAWTRAFDRELDPGGQHISDGAAPSEGTQSIIIDRVHGVSWMKLISNPMETMRGNALSWQLNYPRFFSTEQFLAGLEWHERTRPDDTKTRESLISAMAYLLRLRGRTNSFANDMPTAVCTRRVSREDYVGNRIACLGGEAYAALNAYIEPNIYGYAGSRHGQGVLVLPNVDTPDLAPRQFVAAEASRGLAQLHDDERRQLARNFTDRAGHFEADPRPQPRASIFLTGDPAFNEEIIRDAFGKRGSPVAANAEHQAEMNRLNEAFKTEIESLTARTLQLSEKMVTGELSETERAEIQEIQQEVLQRSQEHSAALRKISGSTAPQPTAAPVLKTQYPVAAWTTMDAVEFSDIAYWSLKVIQSDPTYPATALADESINIGLDAPIDGYRTLYAITRLVAPPEADDGTILPNVHYADRRMGGGGNILQPPGTATQLQREALRTALTFVDPDLSDERFAARDLTERAKLAADVARTQIGSGLSHHPGALEIAIAAGREVPIIVPRSFDYAWGNFTRMADRAFIPFSPKEQVIGRVRGYRETIRRDLAVIYLAAVFYYGGDGTTNGDAVWRRLGGNLVKLSQYDGFHPTMLVLGSLGGATESTDTLALLANFQSAVEEARVAWTDTKGDAAAFAHWIDTRINTAFERMANFVEDASR